MSESLILVEKAGGIATITLNRPEALNALSIALRTELATAIEALEEDPDIRVLILTGAGRAFSAGVDLKELGQKQGALRGVDVMGAMARFSGPIIGAINGVAVTGGFELALGCDVLIASEEARFADTHARVGVLPGWGLSQRLSRAIGIYRAKELSLTGNFLSAAQAEAWGLVNRVVAADALMPAARALAEDMLSTVPELLVNYKKLIDAGFGQDFSTGLETEQRFFKAANRALTPEAVEARRAGIRARGQTQAKE